jgi:hypothetical protein
MVSPQTPLIRNEDGSAFAVVTSPSSVGLCDTDTAGVGTDHGMVLENPGCLDHDRRW